MIRCAKTSTTARAVSPSTLARRLRPLYVCKVTDICTRSSCGSRIFRGRPSKRDHRGDVDDLSGTRKTLKQFGLRSQGGLDVPRDDTLTVTVDIVLNAFVVRFDTWRRAHWFYPSTIKHGNFRLGFRIQKYTRIRCAKATRARRGDGSHGPRSVSCNPCASVTTIVRNRYYFLSSRTTSVVVVVVAVAAAAAAVSRATRRGWTGRKKNERTKKKKKPKRTSYSIYCNIIRIVLWRRWIKILYDISRGDPVETFSLFRHGVSSANTRRHAGQFSSAARFFFFFFGGRVRIIDEPSERRFSVLYIFSSSAHRQLFGAVGRHQFQRTFLLVRSSRDGRKLPGGFVPGPAVSHTDRSRILQSGPRRVRLGRSVQSGGVLRLHILMVSVRRHDQKLRRKNNNNENEIIIARDFDIFQNFDRVLCFSSENVQVRGNNRVR